jgi:hypothetical protein
MFTTSTFAIVFFLRAVSYQPSAHASHQAIIPFPATIKLTAEG